MNPSLIKQSTANGLSQHQQPNCGIPKVMKGWKLTTKWKWIFSSGESCCCGQTAVGLCAVYFVKDHIFGFGFLFLSVVLYLPNLLHHHLMHLKERKPYNPHIKCSPYGGLLFFLTKYYNQRSRIMKEKCRQTATVLV